MEKQASTVCQYYWLQTLWQRVLRLQELELNAEYAPIMPVTSPLKLERSQQFLADGVGTSENTKALHELRSKRSQAAQHRASVSTSKPSGAEADRTALAASIPSKTPEPKHLS